ncbi:hypothetical protein EVAR_40476_1 [Eumeta japonica]|uniref:PiggyBac transposable element-derived protein domain-containing protein n=1 Tax=Eumeta variegata TaxID=151549 RepID=A0A4C1XZV9_EUMVA|nr:hypothetical protein EVAR_40476_1 [Eumeta japonica]
MSDEEVMSDEDCSDMELNSVEYAVQVEDCESESEIKGDDDAISVQDNLSQPAPTGTVSSRQRSSSRASNKSSDEDIPLSCLQSGGRSRKQNYFGANLFHWASMVNIARGRTPQHNIIQLTPGKCLSKPIQAVLPLVSPIEGSNRNVTADNWFSSIELVNHLKEKHLSYEGTLKKNKKEIPPEFRPSRQRAIDSRSLVLLKISPCPLMYKKKKKIKLS